MDQKTNETKISSLPPEMMVKIFEHLTFDERLTASRACKQWHQYAFSSKFSRKVWIRIDDRNLAARCNTRTYQKFRNALIILDNSNEGIRNAITDFSRAAQLDSLKIISDRKFLTPFLDDHLLCLSSLTKLCIEVINPRTYPGDVLRIKHPSLQSLSIDDAQSKCGGFEVNCPKLTDLTIGDSTVICVDLLIQLPYRLQSLNFTGYDNGFEMLQNVYLTKLKKLCFTFSMRSECLEPSFNTMANLVELQLYNRAGDGLTLGDNLSVLTSLSKLTLSDFTVEAKGFAKAMRKMVLLKDLTLYHCKIRSYTGNANIISSEHVENLYLSDLPIMFPYCTKLKSLKLEANHYGNIDDTFMEVCNIYAHLEKLHLSSIFLSTTFSHIQNLNCLRELHLTGLKLNNLDWTQLSSMTVAKLHLERCNVGSTVLQQLVDSIKHALRQLFLDRCQVDYLESCVFDTYGDVFGGLRQYLPRCRVSCKDCEVIKNTKRQKICFLKPGLKHINGASSSSSFGW